MTLSEEDLALFYRLHPALLFFADRHLQLHPEAATPAEFMELSLDEKLKARDAIYDHPEIPDLFVRENPPGFSEEELEIVRGWKHFVRGTFYLVKYLKEYAVFLGEGDHPLAYGVTSLTDDLEEILGGQAPVMLKAVLLPFKGRIIYDGFFIPYNVYFGPGIRRSLNADYQEAKARHGIVTTLPFTPQEGEEDDAERLKFYLKNQTNREIYWEEIEEIVRKGLRYETLYHQEMGKSQARVVGRHLSDRGVRGGWFALLEGMVVASGRTKEEAEEILGALIPPEKRDWVYLFRLRGK